MDLIRSEHAAQAPGLALRALDAFGSLWTGVFLATLLFIYCSIGSAFPQIRQLPSLEMTEFQWFHWWPFNLLVIVFCLSMCVATIRRVPLRLVHLGTWLVHGGIVVLAIGSYYYFGTKVEGDAPVFRRRVTIEVPGADKPHSLVALPGNRVAISASDGEWQLAIQDTNTDWPILSDEHKGKKAYAVNVMVTPPSGDPFIRQLLDGYPQYTEDVLPGKGRAVKSLGRKLVSENLKLSLDFEPQEYFHVQDTWALYVRKQGEKDWSERAIDGLPRYNNRIASRDQVFHEPWDPLTIRPIDLTVPASRPDALSSAVVRITGYLRYARFEQRWQEGGDRLNPMLRITAQTGASRGQTYELLAFDPPRSQAAGGIVQLSWVNDIAQIQSLPSDSRAILHIEIPGTSASLNVPVSRESFQKPAAPIEGTQYSYRILDIHENLALPGSERPVSIVVVEFQTPEGTFRRWVADQPSKTRDLFGESDDPHQLAMREPDPKIVTEFRPGVPPLLFVAHPKGLHFRFSSPNGPGIDHEVRVGESIEVAPGLKINIDAYIQNAVAQAAPYIVPPSSQQPKAGETFAMIRLEVEEGGRRQVEWLPFSPYSFPDSQYSGGSRFTYAPVEFRLAGGGTAEVLFSRKRIKLPAPIAMQDFELDTHIGGYTGSSATIRNYVSRLRFFDQGKWTEPASIAVNHPTEFGGLWYFQSTWDPPERGSPGSGMNFTGLGVGNRQGVLIQLAGCTIAVIGMIYAFYIKPVIRRRQLASQSANLRESAAFNETGAPSPSAVFDEVAI